MHLIINPTKTACRATSDEDHKLNVATHGGHTHGTTVEVSVDAGVPTLDSSGEADGLALRERVAVLVAELVDDAVEVDDAVDDAVRVAVMVTLPATGGAGDAEGDAKTVYAGMTLATSVLMALRPDT